MRHLNAGKKLGVNPDHRVAMLRSMTLALIEHPQIRLPLSRAKALRWHADRVVTWAKRGDLHSRRQIISLLGCSISGDGKNRVRTAVEKIYSDLAPRFKTRPGGYTQIFKLSERRPGDNAEMCIMRYIPGEEDQKKASKAPKKTSDKAAKPEAKKVAAEEAPKAKKTAKAAEAPAEDKPAKAKAKKTTKEK